MCKPKKKDVDYKKKSSCIRISGNSFILFPILSKGSYACKTGDTYFVILCSEVFQMSPALHIYILHLNLSYHNTKYIRKKSQVL